VEVCANNNGAASHTRERYAKSHSLFCIMAGGTRLFYESRERHRITVGYTTSAVELGSSSDVA